MEPREHHSQEDQGSWLSLRASQDSPGSYSPKKLLATLLAAVMAYESVATPFAEASAYKPVQSSEVRVQSSESEISSLGIAPRLGTFNLKLETDLLSVPAHLGEVVETWSPSAYGRHSEPQAKNLSVGQTTRSFAIAQDDGKPFVILLQDVHDRSLVQWNEAEILRHIANRQARGDAGQTGLAARNGVSEHGQDGLSSGRTPSNLIVAVEGAWDRVQTDHLASFPYQDIKNKVTRAFLERGELTGEQMLAIQKAPGDIRLEGVEEKSLYLENVQAREKSQGERQKVLVWLNEMSQRLAQLETALMPPDLKDLQKSSRNFQNGSQPLGEYLTFLKKFQSAVIPTKVGIQKAGSPLTARGDDSHSIYPSVSKALELLKLEKKLSPDAIKAEREAFLSRLSRTLSKDKLEDLLKLSLAYRMGKVSALEFHEKLLSFVILSGSEESRRAKERRDSSVGRQTSGDLPQNDVYPQLSYYLSYLKLHASLSTDSLLQEIESMETKTRELLCRRYTGSYPVLQKLTEVSTWVQEQKKLYALELVPHELNRITSASTHFDLKDLSRFISALEAQVGLPQGSDSKVPEISKALVASRTFYELALKRNEVMVSNLLNKAVILREVARRLGDRPKNLAVKLRLTGSSPSVNARPDPNDVGSGLEITHRPRNMHDSRPDSERNAQGQNDDSSMVVLVAGGFHTPGITKLLQARHVPYAVIRPSLKDNTPGPNPLKIMGDPKLVWEAGQVVKSTVRQPSPLAVNFVLANRIIGDIFLEVTDRQRESRLPTGWLEEREAYDHRFAVTTTPENIEILKRKTRGVAAPVFSTAALVSRTQSAARMFLMPRVVAQAGRSLARFVESASPRAAHGSAAELGHGFVHGASDVAARAAGSVVEPLAQVGKVAQASRSNFNLIGTRGVLGVLTGLGNILKGIYRAVLPERRFARIQVGTVLGVLLTPAIAAANQLLGSAGKTNSSFWIGIGLFAVGAALALWAARAWILVRRESQSRYPKATQVETPALPAGSVLMNEEHPGPVVTNGMVPVGNKNVLDKLFSFDNPPAPPVSSVGRGTLVADRVSARSRGIERTSPNVIDALFSESPTESGHNAPARTSEISKVHYGPPAVSVTPAPVGIPMQLSPHLTRKRKGVFGKVIFSVLDIFKGPATRENQSLEYKPGLNLPGGTAVPHGVSLRPAQEGLIAQAARVLDAVRVSLQTSPAAFNYVIYVRIAVELLEARALLNGSFDVTMLPAQGFPGVYYAVIPQGYENGSFVIHPFGELPDTVFRLTVTYTINGQQQIFVTQYYNSNNIDPLVGITVTLPLGLPGVVAIEADHPFSDLPITSFFHEQFSGVPLTEITPPGGVPSWVFALPQGPTLADLLRQFVAPQIQAAEGYGVVVEGDPPPRSPSDPPEPPLKRGGRILFWKQGFYVGGKGSEMSSRGPRGGGSTAQFPPVEVVPPEPGRPEVSEEGRPEGMDKPKTSEKAPIVPGIDSDLIREYKKTRDELDAQEQNFTDFVSYGDPSSIPVFAPDGEFVGTIEFSPAYTLTASTKPNLKPRLVHTGSNSHFHRHIKGLDGIILGIDLTSEDDKKEFKALLVRAGLASPDPRPITPQFPPVEVVPVEPGRPEVPEEGRPEGMDKPGAPREKAPEKEEPKLPDLTDMVFQELGNNPDLAGNLIELKNGQAGLVAPFEDMRPNFTVDTFFAEHEHTLSALDAVLIAAPAGLVAATAAGQLSKKKLGTQQKPILDNSPSVAPSVKEAPIIQIPQKAIAKKKLKLWPWVAGLIGWMLLSSILFIVPSNKKTEQFDFSKPPEARPVRVEGNKTQLAAQPRPDEDKAARDQETINQQTTLVSAIENKLETTREHLKDQRQKVSSYEKELENFIQHFGRDESSLQKNISGLDKKHKDLLGVIEDSSKQIQKLQGMNSKQKMEYAQSHFAKEFARLKEVRVATAEEARQISTNKGAVGMLPLVKLKGDIKSSNRTFTQDLSDQYVSWNSSQGRLVFDYPGVEKAEVILLTDYQKDYYILKETDKGIQREIQSLKERRDQKQHEANLTAANVQEAKDQLEILVAGDNEEASRQREQISQAVGAVKKSEREVSELAKQLDEARSALNRIFKEKGAGKIEALVTSLRGEVAEAQKRVQEAKTVYEDAQKHHNAVAQKAAQKSKLIKQLEGQQRELTSKIEVLKASLERTEKDGIPPVLQKQLDGAKNLQEKEKAMRKFVIEGGHGSELAKADRVGLLEDDYKLGLAEAVGARFEMRKGSRQMSIYLTPDNLLYVELETPARPANSMQLAINKGFVLLRPEGKKMLIEKFLVEKTREDPRTKKAFEDLTWSIQEGQEKSKDLNSQLENERQALKELEERVARSTPQASPVEKAQKTLQAAEFRLKVAKEQPEKSRQAAEKDDGLNLTARAAKAPSAQPPVAGSTSQPEIIPIRTLLLGAALAIFMSLLTLGLWRRRANRVPAERIPDKEAAIQSLERAGFTDLTESYRKRAGSLTSRLRIKLMELMGVTNADFQKLAQPKHVKGQPRASRIKREPLDQGALLMVLENRLMDESTRPQAVMALDWLQKADASEARIFTSQMSKGVLEIYRSAPRAEVRAEGEGERSMVTVPKSKGKVLALTLMSGARRSYAGVKATPRAAKVHSRLIFVLALLAGMVFASMSSRVQDAVGKFIGFQRGNPAVQVDQQKDPQAARAPPKAVPLNSRVRGNDEVNDKVSSAVTNAIERAGDKTREALVDRFKPSIPLTAEQIKSRKEIEEKWKEAHTRNGYTLSVVGGSDSKLPSDVVFNYNVTQGVQLDLRLAMGEKDPAARDKKITEAAQKFLRLISLTTERNVHSHGAPPISFHASTEKKFEGNDKVGEILHDANTALHLWAFVKDKKTKDRLFWNAKDLLDRAVNMQDPKTGRVRYSSSLVIDTPEYQEDLFKVALSMYRLTKDLKGWGSENKKYLESAVGTLRFLATDSLKGGKFVAKDDTGKEVEPRDVLGYAVLMLEPEVLEELKAQGFEIDIHDVAKRLRQMPDHFVFEWMASNNAPALRELIGYFRVQAFEKQSAAQALSLTAQGTNPLSAAATSAQVTRLLREAAELTKEADDAEKDFSKIVKLLAGLPHRDEKQGGGLAYSWQIKKEWREKVRLNPEVKFNPDAWEPADARSTGFGWKDPGGSSDISSTAAIALVNGIDTVSDRFGDQRIQWYRLRGDVPREDPARKSMFDRREDMWELEKAETDLTWKMGMAKAARTVLTEALNGKGLSVTVDPKTGEITGRYFGDVRKKWTIVYKVPYGKAWGRAQTIPTHDEYDQGYRLIDKDGFAWTIKPDDATKKVSRDSRVWIEEKGGRLGDLILISPEFQSERQTNPRQKELAYYVTLGYFLEMAIDVELDSRGEILRNRVIFRPQKPADPGDLNLVKTILKDKLGLDIRQGNGKNLMDALEGRMTAARHEYYPSSLGVIEQLEIEAKAKGEKALVKALEQTWEETRTKLFWLVDEEAYFTATGADQIKLNRYKEAREHFWVNPLTKDGFLVIGNDVCAPAGKARIALKDLETKIARMRAAQGPGLVGTFRTGALGAAASLALSQAGINELQASRDQLAGWLAWAEVNGFDKVHPSVSQYERLLYGRLDALQRLWREYESETSPAKKKELLQKYVQETDPKKLFAWEDKKHIYVIRTGLRQVTETVAALKKANEAREGKRDPRHHEAWGLFGRQDRILPVPKTEDHTIREEFFNQVDSEGKPLKVLDSRGMTLGPVRVTEGISSPYVLFKDESDKSAFILRGLNLRFNGQPLESVDFSKSPAKLGDVLEGDHLVLIRLTRGPRESVIKAENFPLGHLRNDLGHFMEDSNRLIKGRGIKPYRVAKMRPDRPGIVEVEQVIGEADGRDVVERSTETYDIPEWVNPEARLLSRKFDNREEIYSYRQGLFNKFSGRWIADKTEGVMQGRVVERRQVIGVNQRTGEVKFRVAEFIQNIRGQEKEIDVFEETVDAHGNVVEVYDPKKLELTRYDTIRGDAFYLDKGVRLDFTTSTHLTDLNRRLVDLLREDKVTVNPEATVGGPFRTLHIETTNLKVPTNKVKKTMLEVGSYLRWSGGGPFSYSNLRPSVEDIPGRSQTTFVYKPNGVQFRQLRRDYGEKGELVRDKLRISDVELIDPDGTNPRPRFALPQEFRHARGTLKYMDAQGRENEVSMNNLFEFDEPCAIVHMRDAKGQSQTLYINSRGQEVQGILKGVVVNRNDPRRSRGEIVVYSDNFVWDHIEAAYKPRFSTTVEGGELTLLDMLDVGPDGQPIRSAINVFEKPQGVIGQEKGLTSVTRVNIAFTFRDETDPNAVNVNYIVRRFFDQGRLRQERSDIHILGREVVWINQVGGYAPGSDIPRLMTLFQNGNWVAEQSLSDEVVPLSSFPLDESLLKAGSPFYDPDLRALLNINPEMLSYDVTTAWSDSYRIYAALDDLFGRVIVNEHPAAAGFPTYIDVSTRWHLATPGISRASYRMADGKWIHRNVDITGDDGKETEVRNSHGVVRRLEIPLTQEQKGRYRVVHTRNYLGEEWDSYFIASVPVGLARKVIQGGLQNWSFYTGEDWERLGLAPTYGPDPFHEAARKRGDKAFAVPIGRVMEIERMPGVTPKPLATFELEESGHILPHHPGQYAYRYKVRSRMKSQLALTDEWRLANGLGYLQRFRGAGWDEPRTKDLYFFDELGPSFTVVDGKLYERLKIIPDAKHPGYVWVYTEQMHPDEAKAKINRTRGKLSLFHNGFEILWWQDGVWKPFQPNAGALGTFFNSFVSDYFIPPVRDLVWENPQAGRNGGKEPSITELIEQGNRFLTKEDKALESVPFNGEVPSWVNQQDHFSGDWDHLSVRVGPIIVPEFRVLGFTVPAFTVPQLTLPWWLGLAFLGYLAILGYRFLTNWIPYFGLAWHRRKPEDKYTRLQNLLKVPTWQERSRAFLTNWILPPWYGWRGIPVTFDDEVIFRSVPLTSQDVNDLLGDLHRGLFLIYFGNLLRSRSSPQAEFLPHVIRSLMQKGLLKEIQIGPVLAEVRLELDSGNLRPSLAISEIYKRFIEKAFGHWIDQAFDDIQVNTLLTPGNNYYLTVRQTIRRRILRHLSVLLALDSDYVKDDLTLKEPEQDELRRLFGNKLDEMFLGTGPDTERSLRTWVWREVFIQPTSLTGMPAEFSGDSRFIDFLLRSTAQFITQNEGGKALPFVRAYLKFWSTLTMDQGQYRGQPNGKLLQSRNAGLRYRINARPKIAGELFLDDSFDDLYTYYENPVETLRADQLIPLLERLKSEFPLVLQPIIPDSHNLRTMSETEFVTVLGDASAALFNLRGDPFLGQAVQERLQDVADIFMEAMLARMEPLIRSYERRMGISGLLKHLNNSLPFPIHLDFFTRNGLEAYLNYWNYAGPARWVRDYLPDTAQMTGIRRRVVELAMVIPITLLRLFFTLFLYVPAPLVFAGLFGVLAAVSGVGLPTFMASAPYLWSGSAVLLGLSLMLARRQFWFARDHSKGTSGASTGQANRFWALTYTVWLTYTVGLFYSVLTFLWQWWGIVGGWEGPTAFVLGSFLLIVFSVLTYFSIGVMGVGNASRVEGNRKRVSTLGFISLWDILDIVRVPVLTVMDIARKRRGGSSLGVSDLLNFLVSPFLSLWDWPRTRIERRYRQMCYRIDPATSQIHERVEPISGQTYKQLMQKWIKNLRNTDYLSDQEEQDLLNGRLVRPRSAKARGDIKQFINSFYILKPGIEPWEKMLSLTDMVSASADAQYFIAWDQMTAPGSQDWKETKLHYYIANRRVDWNNFLERMGRLHTTTAARTFLNTLRTLQTNQPIPLPDMTTDNERREVKAVISEAEWWFNRRGYDNIRLFESFQGNQEAFLDNVENYYHDEGYQQIKDYLTGERTANPAAPIAGLPVRAHSQEPTHSSEAEAYKSLKKEKEEVERAGGTFEPWKELYLQMYQRYWQMALDNYQAILREDSLPGQLTFKVEQDGDGNVKVGIASFDSRDRLVNNVFAKLEDPNVMGTAVYTVARGSTGLREVAFETFAPYFQDYVDGLNDLMVVIQAELRRLAVDNGSSNEEIRELDQKAERANFSLNDHVSNLNTAGIEEYRKYAEELAATRGALAVLRGCPAWRRLEILAPESVMKDVSQLRDFSKAEADTRERGMVYFRASRKDVFEGAKYPGVQRSLYAVEGLVLHLVDSLQEVPRIYASQILRVLTEFSRNPRLAIFLNAIQDMTDWFSLISNAAAAAERVWNLIFHRAKEVYDALGAYGKFFVRTEFVKKYTLFLKPHVSEDMISAFKAMSHGLLTKFDEYFQMLWRTAANIRIYIVPAGSKYASGQSEYQGILGRVFMRFRLNPHIKAHWKLGFDLNSWHYNKKAFAAASISSFILIGLVLKWNVFSGLPVPWVWTLIGLLLAVIGINMGAYIRSGWERESLFKGLVVTTRDIVRNMPMYILVIPTNARGVWQGATGESKFELTSKNAELVGTTSGEVSFGELYSPGYTHFLWPIRLGALLTMGVVYSMSFHPYLIIAWMLYLATAISLLSAAFVHTSAPELWYASKEYGPFKTSTSEKTSWWKKCGALATALAIALVMLGLLWVWPNAPMILKLAIGWGSLAILLSTRLGRSIAWAYIRGIASVLGSPWYVLVGLTKLFRLDRLVRPVVAPLNVLLLQRRAFIHIFSAFFVALAFYSLDTVPVWIGTVLVLGGMTLISKYVQYSSIVGYEANRADPLGAWLKEQWSLGFLNFSMNVFGWFDSAEIRGLLAINRAYLPGGPASLVGDLGRLAKDGKISGSVRQAAGQALGILNAESALQELARDPVKMSLPLLGYALTGVRSQEQVVQTLLPALGNGSPAIHLAVTSIFKNLRIASDDVTRARTAALNHLTPDNRRAAIRYLGFGHHESAADQLINLLSDNEPNVRVAAVEALSAIAHSTPDPALRDQIIQAIRPALQDTEPSVRHVARAVLYPVSFLDSFWEAFHTLIQIQTPQREPVHQETVRALVRRAIRLGEAPSPAARNAVVGLLERLPHGILNSAPQLDLVLARNNIEVWIQGFHEEIGEAQTRVLNTNINVEVIESSLDPYTPLIAMVRENPAYRQAVQDLNSIYNGLRAASRARDLLIDALRLEGEEITWREAAYETGRLDFTALPAQIDGQPTRYEALEQFLKLLRDNNLHGIVVGGGALADVFLGLPLDELDLGIKVRLTDKERYEVELTASPGSPELQSKILAQSVSDLGRLADVLTQVLGESVTVERLNSGNLQEQVRFMGLRLHYAGPVEQAGPEGRPIVVRRILADETVHRAYPSNSGARILQMAIDDEAGLYSYRGGLYDIATGEIHIGGDGMNFFLGDILRLLRRNHQSGLNISEPARRLISTILDRYRDGRLPLPRETGPIFEEQVQRILNTAGKPSEAWRELGPRYLDILSMLPSGWESRITIPPDPPASLAEENNNIPQPVSSGASLAEARRLAKQARRLANKLAGQALGTMEGITEIVMPAVAVASQLTLPAAGKLTQKALKAAQASAFFFVQAGYLAYANRPAQGHLIPEETEEILGKVRKLVQSKDPNFDASKIRASPEDSDISELAYVRSGEDFIYINPAKVKSFLNIPDSLRFLVSPKDVLISIVLHHESAHLEGHGEPGALAAQAQGLTQLLGGALKKAYSSEGALQLLADAQNAFNKLLSERPALSGLPLPVPAGYKVTTVQPLVAEEGFAGQPTLPFGLVMGTDGLVLRAPPSTQPFSPDSLNPGFRDLLNNISGKLMSSSLSGGTLVKIFNASAWVRREGGELVPKLEFRDIKDFFARDLAQLEKKGMLKDIRFAYVTTNGDIAPEELESFLKTQGLPWGQVFPANLLVKGRFDPSDWVRIYEKKADVSKERSFTSDYYDIMILENLKPEQIVFADDTYKGKIHVHTGVVNAALMVLSFLMSPVSVKDSEDMRRLILSAAGEFSPELKGVMEKVLQDYRNGQVQVNWNPFSYEGTSRVWKSEELIRAYSRVMMQA